MPRKAVLVVDDQLEVRELLRDLLGYLGHACQTARNAAEALRKLDETAFDVVLTDLVMPGMKATNWPARSRNARHRCRWF